MRENARLRTFVASSLSWIVVKEYKQKGRANWEDSCCGNKFQQMILPKKKGFKKHVKGEKNPFDKEKSKYNFYVYKNLR